MGATKTSNVVNLKNSRGKVVRTTAGVREALLDEMDDLRRGETNLNRVHAFVKLAHAVASMARLDIDYQKYIKSTGGNTDEPNRIPTLNLGDDDETTN